MTLKVEIDFDGDGDYSDPGENVTADVRPRQNAISVQYGRDQSTALAPTVSGSGGLTLSNATRKYSPRNTASILYGKLKPARPVRITRTIGSTTYTLFQGHTDDSPINPDLNSRTVGVTLLDRLAQFRGQNVSTGLYRGLRTGEAIGVILDACNVSVGERDLDAGATVIPWYWEDGTDALTALDKIVRSEGPPAMLSVGGDGEVVFRDRHHRLTRSASLVSQGTWRGDQGIEPTMAVGFTYDDAWRNIVNTGTVSVDVRTPRTILPVWTSDATINMENGEQRVIWATSSDPFYDAIAPEVGKDYQVLQGGVSTALTRTHGISVGIVLTALADSAITNLQLRARPVQTAYTLQITERDTASIDEYGARSYPGDLPWCNQYDADAVLAAVVGQRSQPLPIVTARFVVGTNTVRANAVLARDLSDRVKIIEPETALSNDFHIESIQHQLTGEEDHEVVFGLEAAPVPVTSMFRFNTAGQGFNQGLLGDGLDDPATIFRFNDNTSGHRFGEGTFAL